jgi:hypothetical protein
MFECPYCKRQAMTAWQKLRAGPRRKVNCMTCGKQVSVAPTAILAVLVPVSVAAVVANFTPSLAFGAVAIVASGFAAALVYIFTVPIVGREP